MVWFSLFIPFLVSCVFLVWYRKQFEILYPNPNANETVKETLFILFVPTLFVIFVVACMYGIMINNNTDDIEYLSYHYTKIRHEDEWNERVWVTKNRTVTDSKGKTHTETYRVQETKYHPEKWYGYLNDGSERRLYSNEYNSIKTLWNVPEQFIDMHRDYYTIDGDAQEYKWDNKQYTIKTYVKEHHYCNKIIGTESAFKFNEIKSEEAKELGLYNYPEIKNNEQNPIIGFNRFVKANDIKQFKRLNAFYGYRKQISFYLLIYPNMSASIVEDQRSYWQGGNKNEFIICVGVDSLTNQVQWAQCFSWLDDITIEVQCRDFINNQNKLDISDLSKWLENHLYLWKRKEFKDFNYLNVSLKDNQEITILWTVIIISILIGIFGYFIVKNIDKT